MSTTTLILLKPIEWAQEAIRAYRTHRADRIVAEINQGGDLVENTLRMVDANVAFKAVHASRGKVIRAEPVSALYEQGKVHHVGSFHALENQMCSFTADYERSKGNSPDRLDALVWALSELCVEGSGWWNIMEYYRRDLARAAGNNPDAEQKPASHNDGLIIPGARSSAPVELVRMKAPDGFAASHLYTMSGVCLLMPSDGIVSVSEEDAKPLLGNGWKRVEPDAPAAAAVVA